MEATLPEARSGPPVETDRVKSAIILSLIVHALLCAGFVVWTRVRDRDRDSHAPNAPIIVELAPPAQDTKSRQRVVQSNAGQLAKIPVPDSFLGEKTRIVDRQTVSTQKLIEMAKTGSPAKAADKAMAHPQPKVQAQSQTAARDASDAPAVKPLAKLGLPIVPDARTMRELASDRPQWANIGSEPQDFVNGLKESERTALNTTEYQFFGYHQRIRQRLELEWTRLLHDVLVKFYRNGRQLASDEEYSTRLLVILNDHGEITRIKVVSMSGTEELDQVAIEAFNKAGPFPNPPKGLIRNGEVEVSWELKLRS